MKRAARNWSRWKAEATRIALAVNKKAVDDRIRIIDGLSFWLCSR
jgi:hypothetical protein